MARISKEDIKKWFEAGDKPTEEQFAKLIDECYNNDADVIATVKAWVIEQGYATDEKLEELVEGIREYIDDKITVEDSYLKVKVGDKTYVTEMEELIVPATPVLMPGGTFVSSVVVSGTTSTDGATIYYTTDGSIPTSASTAYTGAFILNQDAAHEYVAYTVKARSFKNGVYSTGTAEQVYNVYRKLGNCTINASGNDYSTSRTITISNTTAGVDIYYTTDGTTPTTDSSKYDSSHKPTISSTTTIKAIATKGEWKNSSVKSSSFTVKRTKTFIGQLSSTITEPTVADIKSLATSYENDSSPAGTYSLDTTFTGYVWFCIPSNQNITAITSGPLAVPYEDPVTVSEWKCYRTSNTVVAGSNEFTIK